MSKFGFRFKIALWRELNRKPGASLFSIKTRISFEGLRIGGDDVSPCLSISMGEI